MSLQSNHGTGTKPRARKPSANLRAVLSVTPVPIPEPVPLPGEGQVVTAVSTIQVGYPTPAVLTCTNPFQAMGTAAATTQMAPTALIYTPNGILVGTLDANPPPPFTWSYTFTDPLPQGVPLALVVPGTTGLGNPDQAVVPCMALTSTVLNKPAIRQARLIVSMAFPRIAAQSEGIAGWLRRYQPTRFVEAADELRGTPGAEGLALLAALHESERERVLQESTLDDQERARLAQLAQLLGKSEDPQSPAAGLVKMFPHAAALAGGSLAKENDERTARATST
jgi:hypothetical protein